MAIETNTDVANKVRGIAAEKRFPRSKMALVLWSTEMAISRRMNGVTAFSAEELIKLAHAMDIHVGASFGERSVDVEAS
ncbi:MAG: hypothetical protein ACOH1J_02665 [Microbacteriaceae bacterium]